MYSKEKLLQMLTSRKASVRYEACEWIRVSQESSPEIVTALEKATHDADKDVSERAALALQTDVHYQMAIKMGMIERNKIEEPDQTVENEYLQYQQYLQNQNTNTNSRIGIVSFGICILSYLALVLIYISKLNINDHDWWILPSSYSITFLIINLFALGLGIEVIMQKDRFYIFPTLGISLSIFIILICVASLLFEYIEYILASMV